MSKERKPAEHAIPVNCPDAHKYDGKKVAICVRFTEGTKGLKAEFEVHQYEPDGPQFVSAVVAARLYVEDPLNAFWAFHLSEAHLASIAPASDEKDDVKFVVGLPFQGHPRNRSILFH
jgi:hypothetical protein